MRRRSISYLINADAFQWKYSSDTGHRWISNLHNIHKLYISSISSSSRTAPSARSNFSSSSRVKGSARSNSIISSFEQGRPVRCSTRTRLDSTRKPSLFWYVNNVFECNSVPGIVCYCHRPFTSCDFSLTSKSFDLYLIWILTIVVQILMNYWRQNNLINEKI